VVAEADRFVLDAAVAPGGLDGTEPGVTDARRILPGEPEHQGADRLTDGRSAGSSRIGPASGDQSGVPTQQCSR
jgi:hypothetical protein